jgi:hypothetical protein
MEISHDLSPGDRAKAHSGCNRKINVLCSRSFQEHSAPVSVFSLRINVRRPHKGTHFSTECRSDRTMHLATFVGCVYPFDFLSSLEWNVRELGIAQRVIVTPLE